MAARPVRLFFQRSIFYKRAEFVVERFVIIGQLQLCAEKSDQRIVVGHFDCAVFLGYS